AHVRVDDALLAVRPLREAPVEGDALDADRGRARVRRRPGLALGMGHGTGAREAAFRLRVIPASPELVRARFPMAITRAADLGASTVAGPPGRGRAAHLVLAEPVLHPLIVAERPSPIALLLDLRHRDLLRAARRGPDAARSLAALDLAALVEAIPGAL